MKLENKKGEYLMALVDLTSVTTGNIGTNTNFIVEENKVLKRISQSSLLKTSAISTTQVNSTTNVPSSSLVYSMNQSINKLNSDAIKQFNYSSTVFDFNDPSYEAGIYRLGSNKNLLNSPSEHMSYGNVLVIRNNSADTLTMLACTFNQKIIFFKNSNESLWADKEWDSFATMDDLVGYVPFAANIPSNQKFYMALVPGDENRIYFYSGENPTSEYSIGYIVLTP